jgi:hypothetical protein
MFATTFTSFSHFLFAEERTLAQYLSRSAVVDRQRNPDLGEICPEGHEMAA